MSYLRTQFGMPGAPEAETIPYHSCLPLTYCWLDLSTDNTSRPFSWQLTPLRQLPTCGHDHSALQFRVHWTAPNPLA